MLRLYTDFNDRTSDGICWNLSYSDIPIENQAEELHLIVGESVKLYQDDDFEVSAVLDFRYVEILSRKTWIAVPDWSTIKRK